MKGPSLLLISIIFAMPGAWAQSEFDNEINNELDRMYSTQGQAVNVSPGGQGFQPQGEVVEVGEPRRYRARGESGQPIYILNQATPTSTAQVQAHQGSVQTQPTTVVEATPLVESQADRLRRQRQNVEAQTEMKIAEELERSRMEDEQRRANVLFGSRMQELNQSGGSQNSNNNQSNVVVVSEPTYQEAPAAVSARRAEYDIQGEMQAAVSDLRTENDRYYNEQVYVNGLVGFGDYPDAINVRSNLSLGVGVGTRFRDRMMLEGNFVYGNFDIEHLSDSSAVGFYPEITSMDQYSMGGTFKYQVLGGILRPHIGATMVYQYRSFAKSQYYFIPSEATSHAADFGAVLGADIEVSPDFAIGIDYRYLWNVYSRASYDGAQGSFVNPVQNFGTPIEEMNQSLLSVMGRVTF